jgi:hypothetical protein
MGKPTTGWTPPADEKVTESSWTPPSDERVDPEPDNSSWLQKAAGVLQPLSDAAGRIQSTMPMAAAVVQSSSWTRAVCGISDECGVWKSR